jgi:hypothetical protein
MEEERVSLPPSQWKTIRIFEPVIAAKVFDAAQRRLTELNGSCGKTTDEMLADLKRIIRKHGRASVALIEKEVGAGKSSNYFSRFGSLSAAYKLMGYSQSLITRGTDDRGQFMTREAMLQGLRDIEKDNGIMSLRLLRERTHLPSAHMYRKIFGSIANAYREAGIHRSVN